MGFGDYPAEYNAKVHGPYDPARFYGKGKQSIVSEFGIAFNACIHEIRATFLTLHNTRWIGPNWRHIDCMAFFLQ